MPRQAKITKPFPLGVVERWPEADCGSYDDPGKEFMGFRIASDYMDGWSATERKTVCCTVAIFEMQPYVRTGCIGVVEIEGKLAVGRFYPRGAVIELRPYNSAYAPATFSARQVLILGALNGWGGCPHLSGMRDRADDAMSEAMRAVERRQLGDS